MFSPAPQVPPVPLELQTMAPLPWIDDLQAAENDKSLVYRDKETNIRWWKPHLDKNGQVVPAHLEFVPHYSCVCGEWDCWWFRDGSLHMEKEVSRDWKKRGEWERMWWPNGQLHGEVFVPERTGTWWHPNGKVECKQVKNVVVGEWDADGNEITKVDDSNRLQTKTQIGVQRGSHFLFWSNGRVARHDEYDDSGRCKHTAFYYSNCALAATDDYDKRQTLEYYKSGQKRLESVWDENGVYTKQVTWKKDGTVGEPEEAYDDDEEDEPDEEVV